MIAVRSSGQICSANRVFALAFLIYNYTERVKKNAIYKSTQPADSAAGSTLNNDLYLWTTRKLQLMQLRQSQFFGNGNPPRSSHPLFDTPRVRSSQKLFLTQDLGAEFVVTVSPFDPEPGDATGYNWEDTEGNPRRMEMPAYYISDLEEALFNIKEFASRSRSLYIEAHLSDSNSIIRQTFQLALGYLAFTRVCIEVGS